MNSKRSCDLMLAYLAETARPLPAKADHALRGALKYKNGWELMEIFDRNEDRLLRLLKEHFEQAARATRWQRLASA